MGMGWSASERRRIWEWLLFPREKFPRIFFTTGGNLCSTALFHHIRQRKCTEYRQLGCTNVKSGHFRLIERLAGRPAGTSRMTYGDAVRSAATTRSARRVVCRAPNPVKSKGAGRVARRVVRRAAWVAAKAGDWGPLDVVSTGRSSFAGRCLVTCRQAVA